MRNVVRIALVLVAAATLLRPGTVGAQSTPTATLGGYQGTAAASGVHAFYNPAGLLPLAPPVDLGAPDALATIASGPLTFARASIADPGDLLANPDALLQAGGQPAGTVPAYPYRITASNGVAPPSTELTPAPGLDSRVAADDNGSSASASITKFAAPAVLTFGATSSSALTTFDGSSVSIHARTEVSGLNFLNLLTIDSIVTDLTATADGATTSLTGGTVVTGARALGQPVTIDATGVHPGGGSGSTANPVVESFRSAIAALGMSITIASPVQQQTPTAGQLTAAGLRIDLEVSERTYPALGTLFALAPPLGPIVPGAPSGDDVLALARARHLVSLQVGGASASVSARPSASRLSSPVLIPATSSTGPTTSQGSPVGAAMPAAPIASPSIAPPTAPAAGSRATTTADLAHGIGALALLALILQPLIGARLSRGASLLTSGGLTQACSREGT